MDLVVRLFFSTVAFKVKNELRTSISKWFGRDISSCSFMMSYSVLNNLSKLKLQVSVSAPRIRLAVVVVVLSVNKCSAVTTVGRSMVTCGGVCCDSGSTVHKHSVLQQHRCSMSTNGRFNALLFPSPLVIMVWVNHH